MNGESNKFVKILNSNQRKSRHLKNTLCVTLTAWLTPVPSDSMNIAYAATCLGEPLNTSLNIMGTSPRQEVSFQSFCAGLWEYLALRVRNEKYVIDGLNQPIYREIKVIFCICCIVWQEYAISAIRRQHRENVVGSFWEHNHNQPTYWGFYIMNIAYYDSGKIKRKTNFRSFYWGVFHDYVIYWRKLKRQIKTIFNNNIWLWLNLNYLNRRRWLLGLNSAPFANN